MNGSTHRLRCALLFTSALVLFAPAAEGRIASTGPLDVHILLDNSGSMYPGYQPAGGVGRQALGVRFYRESPWFREWLRDFVARQSVLAARSVQMSAFTSDASFHPGDVRQVHSRVPLARFDARAALGRVTGSGSHTFLAESLASASRGFEGLVWLITDNIVETGEGTPDLGVRRFFETLRDTPRYRSVHLFKLPVEDAGAGQRPALAVYGILVSDQPVDDATAAYYDRTFRDTFRLATRAGSDEPLFPDHEHLKLKDLDIAPFDLQFEPTIEVEHFGSEEFFGREGQRAAIPLEGTIQSNLTQHTVTSGRWELRVVSPFVPDAEAAERFGLRPIPPTAFEPVVGSLREPIPPTGSRRVEPILRSREPIGHGTSGLMGWLRAAFSGVTAEYESEVEMVFDEVEVHFERDRLAGIFGADVAPAVFDFEDVRTIQAAPERDRIRMPVTSGASRGALLSLILIVLAVLSAAVLGFLLRSSRYRITVGDRQSVVALRRLGRHEVRHQRWRLGVLKRELGGSHHFVPARGDQEVEVVQDGQDGRFRARIRNVGSLQVWVELLHGAGVAAGARRAARGGVIRRPDQAVIVGASGGAPSVQKPASTGAAQSTSKLKPKSPPAIRRP